MRSTRAGCPSSPPPLDVGRIVRALRLSSRPPKAGAPLPPEVATRLTDGAGEALTAEAAPERWVAVLDALAFAPVRDKVIPTSLPKELHADVQATIARLATRIPKIAHIFEITPTATRPARRWSAVGRPSRRSPLAQARAGEGRRAQVDEPKDEAPKAEQTGRAPAVEDRRETTTEETTADPSRTSRPSRSPSLRNRSRRAVVDERPEAEPGRGRPRPRGPTVEAPVDACRRDRAGCARSAFCRGSRRGSSAPEGEPARGRDARGVTTDCFGPRPR